MDISQNTHITKQLSILMVEDELIAQFVQRELLEHNGCHVDLAKTAAEAIGMFGKGYDLILMDIGLPDGNGIEVTARMRKLENQGYRTPIIGVTGYSLHEVEKDCLTAGMDAVLTKPLNIDTLQITLQKILNKE